MNVEIICPLYNAEKYIKELDISFKKQKNVELEKISYIYTESDDKTKEILDEIGATYSVLKKEEFSHSLSRENIAMKSDAGILVFVTQDVEIRNDNWLYELINPIKDGEAEATFSRQLTKYNNIEKYTREKNYPNNSYIVSKSDINKMGLRAFFFSDASAAIKTEIFKSLNGYDNKRLPISEDMYIAYKIIMNGFRIKYCADSIVYHSHQFTLKQLYLRYYDTGVFMGQNDYLDKYNTNKVGGGLAVYIFKRAIHEKNLKVLLRFFPDMIARFIGMKIGYYKYRKGKI